MIDKILYEKLKDILQFIDSETSKPLDTHNYETTIWSHGYKKAMITVRDYIWNVLNRSD